MVLDGEVEVGVEDVSLEALEADLEAILVLQLSRLQVAVDSGRWEIVSKPVEGRETGVWLTQERGVADRIEGVWQQGLTCAGCSHLGCAG